MLSNPAKLIACLVMLSPATAIAQAMTDHQHGAAAPAGHDHMAGMGNESDLPEFGTGLSIQMKGALGDYSMMRDASGTAWQPDTAMMEGITASTRSSISEMDVTSE